MKHKIILVVGSDMEKKSKLLETLRNKIDFSYIKLEALLSTVAESLNRNITEQEGINFFHKFLSNINKSEERYIIDLNDCKEEKLNKYINNQDILVVKIDDKEITKIVDEIEKNMI